MTYDRQTRYDLYEQAGVSEYWLVNPKERSIEVLVLEGRILFAWSISESANCAIAPYS